MEVIFGGKNNCSIVSLKSGGSYAPVTTEISVSGILNVLENLNENNTGHFIRFDGKEAVW